MAKADSTQAKVVVPDNFLIAIGRVTVQWNLLEAMLEMMLGKLAGMDVLADARAKIMVNHMTWPLKIDIFGSICNELVDDYPRLKGYRSTLELLNKAQQGRNRIVHALWGYEGGKVTINRATARGKLKVQMEEISVEQIDAVFREINAANAALYNLVIGT
jgi:hypothetical protein